MAIKALFPSGKDSITVSGLYQWDYGQVLEIESADIGSEIVEVHFACTNMSEAVVRSCTFANGVGTVTIPDSCLEQSTPINAWIYRIVGTQGHTVGTVILPVTARTRPSVAREIPQEVSNQYTELITEVNKAVADINNGKVVAAKALQAETATSAASAGNASSANYAKSAGSAGSANKASLLSIGVNFTELEESDIIGTIRGGLVSFKIQTLSEADEVLKTLDTATIIVDVAEDSYSPSFYVRTYTPKNGEALTLCRLHFDGDGLGEYYVRLETMSGDSTFSVSDNTTYRNIYYKYLSNTYPVG